MRFCVLVTLSPFYISACIVSFRLLSPHLDPPSLNSTFGLGGEIWGDVFETKSFFCPAPFFLSPSRIYRPFIFDVTLSCPFIFLVFLFDRCYIPSVPLVAFSRSLLQDLINTTGPCRGIASIVQRPLFVPIYLSQNSISLPYLLLCVAPPFYFCCFFG